MAHKKAMYDYQYNKRSNEAKHIVMQWFKDNNMDIDFETIYIIWFAFTKVGYRCMITSDMYQNNFFEINTNVSNGEMVCRVMKQIECIVHPSQAEAIAIPDSNNLFD